MSNENEAIKKIGRPRIYPKPGELVISDKLVVLVTGKGNQSSEYPCFAGVVIIEDPVKSPEFKVGLYSKTWDRTCFKKLDFKINLFPVNN